MTWVNKKREAQTAIADNEADDSERRARKLMMMRDRKKEKGN